MQVVAESIVFAARSSQRRRRVRISVTRPEADAHGDFQCSVELKGLERRRNIYGVDSFQALMLAVGFLQTRISALLEDGWKFYFRRDDDEPLDLRLMWLAEATKYETTALSNQRVERSSKKGKCVNSERG
jgi:hypothetical protein